MEIGQRVKVNQKYLKPKTGTIQAVENGKYRVKMDVSGRILTVGRGKLQVMNDGT